MGCGHSKISIIYSRKSKAKRSSKKSEAPEKSDSEEEDGTEKEKEKCGNIAEDDDDKQNQIKASLGGPLLPPIDISTSQQDFFKMLDEKIENGPDYNSESESEILAENQRITALLKDWESASGGSGTSLNQMPPQIRNSENKDCMNNKNHIIRPKPYDVRDVLLYNSEQFNNNTIATSLQRASEIRAELGRNYGANPVQVSQSIIHQNYGVALLQDPKLPQQYHQMQQPAYYHAQQEPIYPPYAQHQQPPQPYAQQVSENYSAHHAYAPQTQQGFPAQIPAPPGYAQYLGYSTEQPVTAPPTQYRQVYANYVMHQPSPGPPQHVLSYPTQYQVISPLYSSQSTPTPRQHNPSYTMKPNPGNIPGSAGIPGNPPSYPIRPSGPGNPLAISGNSLGNADLSGSPGLINRNQQQAYSSRPLSGQRIDPAGQDVATLPTSGSSNLATKGDSSDVPIQQSIPMQTKGTRAQPQSQFQKINSASGNYVKSIHSVADHSQIFPPAPSQGHYQNPESLSGNPVPIQATSQTYSQFGKFDSQGHYQNTNLTSGKSVKTIDKTSQQKRSLYAIDQTLYSQSDESSSQGHYQNTGSLSDKPPKTTNSLDKKNPHKGALYAVDPPQTPSQADDNQGHYQNTNTLSGNSIKANFTSVNMTSQQKGTLYELDQTTSQSPLQSGNIVKSTNQGHYQNTDSLSENPVKTFLDKTNSQKGPLYGVDQATLQKNFVKSNSDPSKPKGPLYGVDLATLQSNVANRIQKNLVNVDRSTSQTNFVKKGPLYGVDQASLQNNVAKTNYNVADHSPKVQKIPTFAETESSDGQAQKLEPNFQKMSIKVNKQPLYVEQTQPQKIPTNVVKNNSDAHAQYPAVTFQTVPILVKKSNEVTCVPRKNLAGRHSPD